MFKNIIAPMQAWLLSQGRCVGCGKPLSSKRHEKLTNKTEKVICSCARIFIYNPKIKKYRRALLSEV